MRDPSVLRNVGRLDRVDPDSANSLTRRSCVVWKENSPQRTSRRRRMDPPLATPRPVVYRA